MDISADMFVFLAIILCYTYVILSAFFSHRKCNFIHETAISILFGVFLGAMIISFTSIFSSKNYQSQIREIIILILLPPMLFEDGYNIRKRKFFQNIMYINLYGVLGTILNFFTLFGLFSGFNYFNLIKSINNETIKLQNWQMLAMASCLCSIDTVVAQKIVNPQRYPKLFSIIFGQSIMKDTIAVTLFDSIIHVYQKLYEQNTRQFNADAIGFLVLKFLEVIVGSILIGTFCGIITTFIFKNFRFLLDQKGVAEVALVILTGYGSYIISQWATFSGVISMLFCGITLSHFNIYNLTEQGKLSAKISISALAKVAEGLLFFLLGAFIFAIQINEQSDKSVQYTFSWSLLLICIFALMVGRFINVYLTSLLGYLVVGKQKWRLNFYQYEIISISGLVKGAIPFALILSMPLNERKFSTACVQNTVITIVFLTSLILNSLMPKILRGRLDQINQMMKKNSNHPSLYDSMLIQYQQKQIQYVKQQHASFAESNKAISDKYSQVSGRFQSKKQLQKLALLARLKSTTQKYWKRCEQGCLKPFLIYDYHNRKQQIKMQKIKARKLQVEQFWRKFTGQNMLDPDDEQNNKFVDVKLIDNDVYSQDGDKQIVQQQNGDIVFFSRQPPAKTEQQISEIKIVSSKTQPITLIKIQNMEDNKKRQTQFKKQDKKALNKIQQPLLKNQIPNK